MAEEYFGVKPDEKLSIHVADARAWLARTGEKYDYIQIDLFHQGPYIPFYVATKEFFELVKSHLNPGGVMIYNVLADPEEGAEGLLLKPIANTVASVFPSTAWIPMWDVESSNGDTNAVVVACNADWGLRDIQTRIFEYSFPPDSKCGFMRLEIAKMQYSRAMRGWTADNDDIFTDDCSMIEKRNHILVQRLMQRYHADE